mmetsp:Transcript_12359/g.20475  ORF Transcript_12359/g.20475 Transcript_12359/m.20475 type:complete len:119 (+) Transcript_12359:318-674(+)
MARKNLLRMTTRIHHHLSARRCKCYKGTGSAEGNTAVSTTVGDRRDGANDALLGRDVSVHIKSTENQAKQTKTTKAENKDVDKEDDEEQHEEKKQEIESETGTNHMDDRDCAFHGEER